jgi:NADH-quinone oxidoreductase subunit M
MWRFDWTGRAGGMADAGGFQLVQRVAWLPSLGLELSVGVDAIAMMLVALTCLLAPICVVASKTAITDRVKTYYAWLLVLQSAMVGVFIARDLLLFYMSFEFTLIPMYILISLYGSTNRKRAATKFFIFTFTGSIIALVGLLYVALQASRAEGGAWTFDIARLEAAARTLSAREQAWVLLALMAGFAVKVPLFPVHTWLPLAHTEAPTAGSVVLAGVLLKLGTFAIYRFALGFCPVAVVEYAPWIAVLAITGIIYGGLICWVQTDVKKLVAYSSVSHLGFCVLGMFALTGMGLTGSVLYMINHGLSTGALFLLIGMVYERYHTRSMRELGGLAGRMPIWATFMVFFSMASVGLPGLNGFVSEFLCIAGTFVSGREGLRGAAPGLAWGPLGPWYAAIAGTGVVIGAIYLLYVLGKVLFGPLVEPAGHGGHGRGSHGGLPTDLGRREVAVLIPLAGLCLWLGVYPKPVIDALESPVNRSIARVREAWDARVIEGEHPPAHVGAAPVVGVSGEAPR